MTNHHVTRRRYGYLYECRSMVGNTCYIQPVPFRGAPCSDAAGREIDYADVVRCELATKACC